MTRRLLKRQRQRGAALIVVLLLAATLSFVLLSITATVTAGVRRGANERARTAMLWRALAAETIAFTLLERAKAGGALAIATNEGGLFTQQLALPIERGEAALRFADASRCFNINSLITEASGSWAVDPDAREELIALAIAIGLGDNEASEIADVIADFLDTDTSNASQGAEDGFYTALTTPFRTAGGPIGSVSELRAMDGITREIYAGLAPYLCARGADEKMQINVNALTPETAPLIHAMTTPPWPVEEVRARIAARPPGGWTPDETAFWEPYTSAGTLIPANRTGVSPTWVEARLRLEADERIVEETLLIRTPAGAGKVALYGRVLGDGQ
ncbi:MAG: type II secretion system minor pseudopilin GspK [Parvularculaceae bacterium]